MKLDLNKFYNSNYKDFVHKEAVEEALRMVAEIDLKDVEIDTILSITFSVDEFGENPIYVEYLDKDGKKHIVRIRPAVTNEIQEMLKRYVTLEQHETDKQDIYNHFEHMHVPMEIRSANGLDDDGNKFIVLNNDNSYLSFQVDPETDNEIQWLCIHNKGGLGPQSMYFARFMDYAKIDQVPSNAEFLEKIRQLEELIQRKSQETLQSSKEYTDTQDNTLRTEITTNVTNQINETMNGILSYVDDEVDKAKEYAYTCDVRYDKVSKRYTDNAKQEAVNSSKTYTDNKTAETLETSKTYTDAKHTEVTQQVTELENDMNTKLNDYLLKNKIKYNNGEFSKINFVHGTNDSVQVHDDSGNLSMTGKFISDSQAENITVAQNKLSEIIGCATNITWGPTPNLNFIRLIDRDKYVETHMHKTPAEVVAYLPKENLGEKIDSINSNKADKQTVDGLSQLVQEIATKVDGIEIGERTKVNFTLANSFNEKPVNPKIKSNDSYYVKVGSQYIVNVYLTVEIDVIPTSGTQLLSFSWTHDLPGENPPLTITVDLHGNRGMYSTTQSISSNRNRVPLRIPAFPATETYIENTITIYGTAITKDSTKEGENND